VDERFKERMQAAVIAVPCFGEEVAPCFEATRRFRLWSFSPGGLAAYKEITCEQEGGLARLNLLKRHNVNVLICNGIDRQLWQMLEAEDCTVIASIVGPAVDAIYGFLAGKLNPRCRILEGGHIQPHTADLVRWTEELLTALDWQVNRVTHPDIYPLDLIARRACPVCQRPVRAAFCCGAHAWQVDTELLELHRIASGYNARVYIHQALPGLAGRCRELGIELLEPSIFAATHSAESGLRLPPLRGRIDDHPEVNKS